VKISTNPLNGREYEAFEMECSATCRNVCLSYTWFHGRKRIHNGNLLNIKNLSNTDSGEYTCTVSDSFGITNKSYDLHVKVLCRYS
jgi:hypothetical protein